MKYQVNISYTAFNDLENIKLYISENDINAANKYISHIFDRLESLCEMPYRGLKFSNSIFEYAKAYCLFCFNHVAIYQINEQTRTVSILRVLSHYQDWKNIVNKDLLNKTVVIASNDSLSITKMNPSMYYEVYKNSLDENNRKYVPDEVFETLEEATDVVDEIIKNYESANGPYVYAIIRNTDSANIGYVQLVRIEEGWEIGYHIAKPYTGNGYATEAVNLFINHLKENTQLKEIYGVALYNNKVSKRVLDKCGFKLYFEGQGMYQGKRRKIIKTIKQL